MLVERIAPRQGVCKRWLQRLYLACNQTSCYPHLQFLDYPRILEVGVLRRTGRASVGVMIGRHEVSRPAS